MKLKRMVAALEKITNTPLFFLYIDQRGCGVWNPEDGCELGFDIGGVIVPTVKEVEQQAIIQGWKGICYVEVVRTPKVYPEKRFPNLNRR